MCPIQTRYHMTHKSMGLIASLCWKCMNVFDVNERPLKARIGAVLFTFV